MNRVLMGCTTGLLLTGMSSTLLPHWQSAIAHETAILLAQAPTLQNSWRLVGWGKPENLQRSQQGSEITAEFKAGQLAGSAGCNRYTGSYTVKGSALTTKGFATTRKACPQPIMAQESTYLKALGSATQYTINNQNQLRISYQMGDSSGVLVYALLPTGMKPTPLPSPRKLTPKPVRIEP